MKNNNNLENQNKQYMNNDLENICTKLSKELKNIVIQLLKITKNEDLNKHQIETIFLLTFQIQKCIQLLKKLVELLS